MFFYPFLFDLYKLNVNFNRLIPPSTLRRSTNFSTKENVPKLTARRVTQLPESNVNNTSKRSVSGTAIKTPSIRASVTANKPAERYLFEKEIILLFIIVNYCILAGLELLPM